MAEPSWLKSLCCLSLYMYFLNLNEQIIHLRILLKRKFRLSKSGQIQGSAFVTSSLVKPKLVGLRTTLRVARYSLSTRDFPQVTVATSQADSKRFCEAPIPLRLLCKSGGPNLVYNLLMTTNYSGLCFSFQKYMYPNLS